MRKTIRWMALFVFAMMFSAVTGFAAAVATKDTVRYQCPMMCEGVKTYDAPGTCPVCGMDLEKKEVKTSTVKISGTMLNVMHLGQLYGTIRLDTIHSKKHLYGLGPVEYLKGEILIDDGHAYVSKVASDGSIVVEENFNTQAPFFVYDHVSTWEESALPDFVVSLPQLEVYLNVLTRDHARPFVFRVKAAIDNGTIHIVNLPDGAVVNSPEDAHRHQQNYNLKDEEVELIGFFSTEHQGIFTHHDTYMHIHLITADKKKMGHLENVMLKNGAKLYLPVEK